MSYLGQLGGNYMVGVGSKSLSAPSIVHKQLLGSHCWHTSAQRAGQSCQWRSGLSGDTLGPYPPKDSKNPERHGVPFMERAPSRPWCRAPRLCFGSCFSASASQLRRLLLRRRPRQGQVGAESLPLLQRSGGVNLPGPRRFYTIGFQEAVELDFQG